MKGTCQLQGLQASLRPLVHAVPSAQGRDSGQAFLLPAGSPYQALGNTLPWTHVPLTKAVKPLKCQIQTPGPGLATVCAGWRALPQVFLIGLLNKDARPPLPDPPAPPRGLHPILPRGRPQDLRSVWAWALDHTCPGKREACVCPCACVWGGVGGGQRAVPTLVLSLVVVAGLVGDAVPVGILPHRQVVTPLAGAGVAAVDHVLHRQQCGRPRPLPLDVDPVCGDSSHMGRRQLPPPTTRTASGVSCLKAATDQPPLGHCRVQTMGRWGDPSHSPRT